MKDALLRRISALVLAAASTGAVACRKGDAAAERSGPTPTRALSFRSDVLPVLGKHCASAEGCHGNEPTDSVALDLRPRAAYAELVGKHAHARKEALRVKAGDPSASFVLAKVTGALGPREGKAMPIDVQTGAPVEPSPLPPDFIEKIFKPWILAGAPNN